jgi:hypothetical protein
MFLWLKIIGLNDANKLVTTRCLDKLLILAPGYALSANTEKPSPYVRISYSIASPEEVDRVSVFFYYKKVFFTLFHFIFSYFFHSISCIITRQTYPFHIPPFSTLYGSNKPLVRCLSHTNFDTSFSIFTSRL